jgi:chaperonin cofactor prefoldin
MRLQAERVKLEAIMEKEWTDMSADEKAEWLKNEVEDLAKAVEGLHDTTADTRRRMRELKERLPEK